MVVEAEWVSTQRKHLLDWGTCTQTKVITLNLSYRWWLLGQFLRVLWQKKSCLISQQTSSTCCSSPTTPSIVHIYYNRGSTDKRPAHRPHNPMVPVNTPVLSRAGFMMSCHIVGKAPQLSIPCGFLWTTSKDSDAQVPGVKDASAT